MIGAIYFELFKTCKNRQLGAEERVAKEEISSLRPNVLYLQLPIMQPPVMYKANLVPNLLCHGDFDHHMQLCGPVESSLQLPRRPCT